jgi:outer membrane protein
MNSGCKLVAVMVAAALWVALGRPACAEEKRIAVVNVSRVFDAYVKVKDVEEKMKKLYETEDQAVKRDQTELKKWEDKLKVNPLPNDNVEKFKEIQKFELAKLEFQLRIRKLNQEVEEKKKNEMREVLNDIKKAIRDVGNAEKFDLVLRAPEFEDIFDPSKMSADDKKKEDEQATSAAELVRKFRENPVLYFSQGVDVTDKVIAQLNNAYKAAIPAK